MIEQLRAVGDQLRAAWDDYYRVYSAIHTYHTQVNSPQRLGFPKSPEVSRQLDTELAFLSSYESQIQEIRITISRARNYSPGLAPINTLPSEILSRIFGIVLAQPCNVHQVLSSNEQHYPRYPDHLAHVCSLWRKIAISSRSLWTHIDLSPYKSDGLVARAETHIMRAGKLPLELHVTTDDGWFPDHDKLYLLLSRISRRVESLELRMFGPFGDFHADLFRLLISERPTLTKLLIRSDGYYSNNFVVPNSFDPTGLEGHFWPLLLDCTEDEIENTFAPLSVLHLRGVFPLWSSRAYHSLVDLRLLSSNRWSQIKETELMVILKSSPGLRILHFGLEIRDSGRENTAEVNSVNLQDLQVLKILPHTEEGPSLRFSSVLRLLKPGSKPLRLSFEDHYLPDTSLVKELESFFARSRVTWFYTRSVFPPLSILLRHAAHLEKVVLDDFESHPHDHLPPTWLQVDEFALPLRLESLHITRSNLFEGELRLLLESCPDGVVLHSCNVHCDSSEHSMPTTLTALEMSETFPTVKITDHTLYPMEDPTAAWDILH